MQTPAGQHQRSFGATLLMLIAGITVCNVGVAQEFDDTWNVEFNTSPVIAPGQVVGRGGAEIGIAEGSGSQPLNPAAVANRFPYNGGEWFDWDWSIDWLLVGLGDGTDVANDGRDGKSDDSALINLALNFLFGRFGVGITAQLQNLSRSCVEVPGQDLCRLEATRALMGLNLGYNFLGGDLVVAVEMVLPLASYIQGEVVGEELRPIAEASMIGFGAHLGVLWRPHDWPFRIGATFRTPMNLNPDTRTGTTTLVHPKQIVIPWQAGLGAVFSLGPKTLNPKPTFGDDTSLSERYAKPMWREYYLIALDLLLLGPVEKASGVAAWLDGEAHRSGRHTSLSARLGIEGEFWPRVMRGRLGTYYEPSRFDDRDGRFHATGGFDIRLFELVWEWRFSFGVDWAPRYLNLMFSLGFWH